MLEGLVVGVGRGEGIPTEKTRRKSNVRAAQDVGVADFSKDIAIAKGMCFGEGKGGSRFFGETLIFRYFHDMLADFRTEGSNVMPIGCARRRLLPSVSLEHAINVGRAAELDTVLGG